MKHIRQLDGLRCIAVSLVLLEHYAIILGRHIAAGYYGVDLFFVISGFLITSILVKSEEPFLKAYKKFIGRRTLRIFPIYYLTILVLLLMGNEYVSKYLVYCLTYTYNYAWVYFNIPMNSITHFWSLCIEEQFYLFWPFIILGLRKHPMILKYVILTIIIICSLQILFNIFPSVTPYNFVGIFPQANSLGIGALGALLNRNNKFTTDILENKWIEVLSVVLLLYLLNSTYNIKYIICPFISLYFVLKTAHKGFSFDAVNNFLQHRAIVYIGSISYGIYLFHLPIGFYLTQNIFEPYIWNRINWNSLGDLKTLQRYSWVIKLPVYSLITIGLAHLSYHYIEKPILSLKDKWFKYS